ncbi:MAG TPA: nucleoside hydrolase [Gaiellales bacterium]
MAIPIILDCDPGHDDAIAIMLALGSPEVDLIAVTAVSGNAPLHHTRANAIRVLDHLGRSDIPVAAGAARPLVQDPFTPGDVHGPTGIDGPDLAPAGREPVAAHAIDLIAELALGERRPVTLVATGPLTNVALFVARHPDAAAALGRIVFMGGAIGLGNVTPAAEFNIWVDPEAASAVLRSGAPLRLVGLDVTLQVRMSREDGRRMAEAEGSFARFAGEYTLAWIDHMHATNPGDPSSADSCAMHDPLALAAVPRPDLLTWRDAAVDVVTGPSIARGVMVADLLTSDSPPAANCRIAVGVDVPGFTAYFVERMSQL